MSLTEYTKNHEDFKALVVPIVLEPHPNADMLSLIKIAGYTVCGKTSDWIGKTKAVYLPVDSLVPDTPEYSFLAKRDSNGNPLPLREKDRRIKAKKLRGIFSMGMLVPAKDEWEIGRDVKEELDINKYEEIEILSNDAAPIPSGLNLEYSSIAHLRKFPDLFNEREVIALEKCHGTNARYSIRQDVLHVGCHHQWKQEGSVYHKNPYYIGGEIKELLEECGIPEATLFGELYGQVPGCKYEVTLKYGLSGISFLAFDIFDPNTQSFLEYDKVVDLCNKYNIPTAPVLYKGVYDYETLKNIAEKDSVISSSPQIMEGLVVRLAKEALIEVDHNMRRAILKYHSERYLLAK